MANNDGRRRRFGAVRQLPSKKWQARYPGADGKLLIADRTFATKTAGEEWLTDTEAEMRRGDMVFGTYATAWIKERPNLRPRTRELYSILLRLHLKPTFGDAAIPAIKEADVRSWRATRLEGGLGLSNHGQGVPTHARDHEHRRGRRPDPAQPVPHQGRR